MATWIVAALAVIVVLKVCAWLRGRQLVTFDYPGRYPDHFYRERPPAEQTAGGRASIDQRYDAVRLAFIHATTDAAAAAAFAEMISRVRDDREDWPPYQFKRRQVRLYLPLSRSDPEAWIPELYSHPTDTRMSLT
jgi:hypothetical protein